MKPLHHPSNTNAVAAPYLGLYVFSPHSNLGGVGYAGASQHYNNLYPWSYSDCMPYPTLRRYYDVFENIVTNEPTREKEAMTAVVLAFFSSQNVAVLATDLLDFKGQAEKTSNQLTWTFADTKDLGTLTLEKSKDGQDFIPLSITT
jgi:hypothetical protein